MRSPDEILREYHLRWGHYAPLHAKMQEVYDIYNGLAEVPLPDLERDEKPAIPNLLQQGVDQMAGRITSVTPSVSFSSARPGIRKADRNAHAAAQTITGWWQGDRLMMKQKSRGRRLIAYGMAPTVMRWDYKKHAPVWEMRHPLESLPSYDLQPGQVRPVDCIFTYKRTARWLKQNGYSDKVAALTGDYNFGDTNLVNVVEYIDAEQTVLLIAGYYDQTYYGGYANPGDSQNPLKGIVLESFENLTDHVPVTIPTRLTLDAMTGQFDGMIGMYYQQAKLMALETIAVEKGIFPDTYLISRPGEQGRFIDGPHDGRTGRVNVITGGDVKEMNTSPGYLTNPTIDRLERAQRVTSGIPAEFGGESGSNIRTGRRGDAVLSATIDFPIAEAQQIFEAALEEENRTAMQMAKRIDGMTKRTIYVGTGNARRPTTYTPSETFEVEDHVVSYPAAGSDMNTLIIGLGQRVGLGIMSKETAATLDPFIDNPEGEHDAIIAEGLEQALMTGIQQQASSGQIPPLVLAKIMRLVKTDKMELAEAMNKITEDALKEQKEAETGAPPETAEMAMAGAASAAMTGSPIPGPSAGQQDLSSLMSTLRKPAMTIQPMRGVDRGAV